jgi:hypothetical protein
VGYFEVNDKIGVAMATQVRDLIFLYNLLEKLIAYVKDEGGNMSTLAGALVSISIVPLLHFQFLGKVHVLAMLSIKHANMLGMELICVGFHEINLKATQSMLQNIITWIKKSNKGHIEW